MWVCPKCGRSFKNRNQSHYCGKKPATIGEYISAQPRDIQPLLRAVYHTIQAALPDAEERMSWGMPTFWKGRNILHFAANKYHLGLYVGAEAVEVFGERLTGFETNKGTIRFPYADPAPLELIAGIAVWCRQAACGQ